MTPTLGADQASVPPPSYDRRAATALHLGALTLVSRLHLLALCRLAIRLAHQQCPPPLPAGPGGAPRVYSEESLVRLALLRTVWRSSRSACGQLGRRPARCCTCCCCGRGSGWGSHVPGT
jgi:hypothetical protein